MKQRARSHRTAGFVVYENGEGYETDKVANGVQRVAEQKPPEGGHAERCQRRADSGKGSPYFRARNIRPGSAGQR
jgi:hypothetical protein